MLQYKKPLIHPDRAHSFDEIQAPVNSQQHHVLDLATFAELGDGSYRSRCHMDGDYYADPAPLLGLERWGDRKLPRR